MKVGSELISMAIDPQLPGHLRVPVTVSLKNTNVSNSVCIYDNSIRVNFSKTKDHLYLKGNLVLALNSVYLYVPSFISYQNASKP